MRIRTSNLTGPALDWAVAKAQGWVDYPNDSIEHGNRWHIDATKAPWGRTVLKGDFNPSTDPYQAYQIIEREKIDTAWSADGWYANMYDRVLDQVPGAAAGESFLCGGDGSTPLIAAMRCFVASKLGDVIEMPGG